MAGVRQVGIVSLGCCRNLVDSERLLGRLQDKGFRIVDIDKAQVAVVNTCAFVLDAKKESLDVILELIERKKQGKLAKIVVCGCLAQRYHRQLQRQLPEVDAFIGALALDGDTQRYPLTPRHYAFLKVCEGCLSACSFCIIPRLKGPFRSLSLEAAVAQARLLDRQGIAELNIVGQDTSAYGYDLAPRQNLSVLVRRLLAACKRVRWMRLLYLYPSRVDDDLLRLIRDEERVCDYIDVPLQHISDRVLARMNRPQARSAQIHALIRRIRRIVPGAAIRTTFIVGFPGETDRDFEELYRFVQETRFERLGVFIYSDEENTRAHALKPKVPLSVARKRFDRLMTLQQEISRQQNSRMLGKQLDVLIDDKQGPGMYLGRSRFDAPEVDGTVIVRSRAVLRPGRIVAARIKETLEYDLVGDAL